MVQPRLILVPKSERSPFSQLNFIIRGSSSDAGIITICKGGVGLSKTL